MYDLSLNLAIIKARIAVVNQTNDGSASLKCSMHTLGSSVFRCVLIVLPVLAICEASPTAVSTPSDAESGSAPAVAYHTCFTI